MKINTTNGSFFDEMYKKNPDPWGFTSKTSELYRYERIYNALNHKHYNLIFEAGCSIGILTKKLSLLANSVTAIDISPIAISLAREYCAPLNNVSINCASIASFCLDKNTDLLILSEIGYYFEAKVWKAIITDLVNHCSPSTTILASHWLGYSADHKLNGAEVHNIIHYVHGLTCEYQEKNPNFHLERWIKA